MRAAALDTVEEWHADAVAMLTAWAASGLPFTAEDLRKSMRPAPSDKAPGNAFQAARRLGLITCIGYKESTDRSRKGGIIRVWTGA